MPSSSSQAKLSLISNEASDHSFLGPLALDYLEQSNDAVCLLNSAKKLEWSNALARKWIGKKSGIPFLLSSPKGRTFDPTWLDSSGVYEEEAFETAEGRSLVVEVRVRKLIDASGCGWTFVSLRDSTERDELSQDLLTINQELQRSNAELEKKNAELTSLQQMLVQAGKMAALGELSAGIAHELNQPLQGIRGYSQELSHILAQKQPDALPYLSEIVSSVDKMAKIIQFLRSFTRKSTEGFDWVDVSTVLDEVTKMLDRQFKQRGIELQMNVDPSLPKVFVNPVQLEQVLINLASNARDAIEETKRGSGRIEIQVGSRGKFIEIRFKDNGCGMDELVQKKIFNPFFTTKEVGKGMGLGLSLSYGIISKFHGSLMVQSELGKGTEFTIRLPVDFREIG